MINLTSDQISDFRRNGCLVLPGFYDLVTDIVPIQRAIYDIIGILIAKYRAPIPRPPFSPENFDVGYNQLIAIDRRYGAEVYDAVKQIPAFVRLVAHPFNDSVFSELRNDATSGEVFPGIAAGGHGIRIDNPNEDRFRANWHQEYPAQLRSLDGIVFWSPLLAVTREMGPVEICPGSHREGPVPVHTGVQGDTGKTGAYSLVLQNEATLLERYPHIAPLTVPGDLVLMDFLLLHASGHNRSSRSRWSMQWRYFNFNEPTGVAHGWKGSYAAGMDFRTVHPELCADERNPT